jgi:hypothetical protein
VLSRIADSLYWVSRYLERAANTARLVEINLLYLLEAEDALSPAAQWRPLLSVSGSEEAFAQCYPGAEITAPKWIGATLEYRPGITRTHSPLAEVWKQRSGACQDFAHLLISLVRSWGVPARYVMGYQDPECVAEDAPPAPHAWAEVLIPGAGWRGFDPCAQLLANDRYVVVAVGRSAVDAAPLRSSFAGAEPEDAPDVTLRIAGQQESAQ